MVACEKTLGTLIWAVRPRWQEQATSDWMVALPSNAVAGREERWLNLCWRQCSTSRRRWFLGSPWVVFFFGSRFAFRTKSTWRFWMTHQYKQVLCQLLIVAASCHTCAKRSTWSLAWTISQGCPATFWPQTLLHDTLGLSITCEVIFLLHKTHTISFNPQQRYWK